MEIFDPQLSLQVQAFATSLAIGLLMGLERERHSDAKAGLRTFALVALLGTLSALIAERAASGWVLALGFSVVGAMMIVAVNAAPADDHDPGTTSVIALMISYALGATVWYGYATLAVMLCIASTALLYFKTELHGFTRSLTSRDLISILQFAVLSFVVLPILPDHDFGPFNAFNPHQIWWMVVLISGVSLAGYTALRFVGTRHGAPVIGFFGGLVSSTATTLVFARHARANGDFARTAAVVILLANLMVTIRLVLLATVLAPQLAVPLAAVLGSGLLFGFGFAVHGWLKLQSHGALPMPEVGNPTELRTALSFGVLYALILFLAALLEELSGPKGLYAVALASGLADVDAITLSSLRLYQLGKLGVEQAVASIALATLANLVVKAGLIIAIGRAPLAWRTLPGLIAIALGMAIAMLMIGV